MSIKKDFASGVFYTSIAKYSGLIIQLVITAILARLLTPDDFGVVAIATVLIQFFNTISEAGIGPAIIQKKELSKDDIYSIFTFTILIGLVLCSLFYFGAEYISIYYRNESLYNVCRWLSLLILFSSADIVPNNLLLKNKRFKTIAIRTFSIQVITGGISIYVAYLGWGMYALVFSALSSKILVFFINYLLNPIYFNFHFKCLAKIATYSFYQFCFNLVNYFSRNLDKLIIGKFLGMNPLGYYEKSYRLMMLPLSNITYVLTPVMHPIFSELQNNRDLLLTHYLKLIKIIGFISFPIMVALFFNAKELVLLFFGYQWEASILPFKILSLTTALQVIHSTAGGIFQAINDTKGLFWVSIISAALMISGFIISVLFFKTIEAVSFSFLVTCTIGSIIVFYVLFKRLDKGLSLFFSNLKLPIVLGVIEFSIMALVSEIIPEINLIISLLIKMSVIILVWFIFINKTKSLDIIHLFKELKK